jgi:hypothetical protein
MNRLGESAARRRPSLRTGERGASGGGAEARAEAASAKPRKRKTNLTSFWHDSTVPKRDKSDERGGRRVIRQKSHSGRRKTAVRGRRRLREPRNAETRGRMVSRGKNRSRREKTEFREEEASRGTSERRNARADGLARQEPVPTREKRRFGKRSRRGEPRGAETRKIKLTSFWHDSIVPKRDKSDERGGRRGSSG